MVTTPQEAAAEVAERAGTMASMMHQRVVGVVENMSFLACPHCGPEHQLEMFGSGGGDRVAATLVRALRVRRARARPDPARRRRCARAATSASRSSRPTRPRRRRRALVAVAEPLTGRGRGLAGMQLGLTPTSKF